MLNRKSFIKQSIGLGTGFFVTSYLGAKPFKAKKKKFTIFHTNDIHSRIVPFLENDAKYPNQGGLIALAKLYTLEKEKVENSILLDCGDVFQGTPYFNFFKGKIEYELMSKMGYTATTLGNHDFDNGIVGLQNVKKHRNFEIICSNYDIENSPLSKDVITHKILIINGITIGLIGLGINPEGLINLDNCKGITYKDPVQTANELAKKLKDKEKCDVVICISHLGLSYKNDKVCDTILAKKSANIDVIIGGHTHSFLDAPMQLKNSLNNQIIVNQAGWSALKLGQINLELS